MDNIFMDSTAVTKCTVEGVIKAQLGDLTELQQFRALKAAHRRGLTTLSFTSLLTRAVKEGGENTWV